MKAKGWVEPIKEDRDIMILLSSSGAEGEKKTNEHTLKHTWGGFTFTAPETSIKKKKKNTGMDTLPFFMCV